ncbi:S8 family serine peptidase [Micromonospora sp. WMMD712]|uniref:S8 family serine peptidase n=1 Tax=Micromonospora sp. WMMD712 TaxID=3016096 RepID=UPI00249C3731|nr:S8 family serine peptidase [Micromonospora sp. WMMD712]WFE61215.1 S8 family serine peptidase [Micromonospora sp. WMMD712]
MIRVLGSWAGSSWARSLACLVAAGALVVAPLAPVAAAPPPAYVKYYAVTAGPRGTAEDLTGLATRFLADPDRADEIYRLNEGRRQPDGRTLTAVGQRLAAGWVLVLPWDAVGDGVRYGLLPADAPNGPPARSTAGTSACVVAASAGTGANWADAALSPARAWPRSRGAGTLVAVVDSGVDAGLPALAGRVAPGSDITTGKARADTDCLGTGTAMASVIAADPGVGSRGPVVGVAPGSRILPVRIVSATTDADPARTALGIEVAVSAGARVVALGGHARLTDSAVAQAVRSAVAHDVVVVAPAATVDGVAAQAQDGLLRVGGVGPDRRPVAAYPAGGVDVTAPGLDVPTLGVGGTGAHVRSGTEYAVAYVAGTAALVRAALPGADAAGVANRIKATADAGGRSSPSPENGWGMIDPLAAVGPAGTAAPASRGAGGPHPLALAGLGLLLLAAVGLLAWRARRFARQVPDAAAPVRAATTSEPASLP